MLLEAQEVSHLPRHRNRRQQTDGVTRDRSVKAARGDLGQQVARAIERRLAAVDQRQHVGEGVRQGPARLCVGAREICDAAVIVEQRADALGSR